MKNRVLKTMLYLTGEHCETCEQNLGIKLETEDSNLQTENYETNVEISRRGKEQKR